MGRNYENTYIKIKTAIQKVYEREWSTQKEGTKSKERAETFLNWFGKETCVNDITTESIRDFKHYLRQKNYSPSTINTRLASVSKLCTYAKGVSGFSFTWGTPLFEYLRTNNQRTFRTTPELELKIIRATKRLGYGEKADLWTFLIEVGCRLSEALKLSWSNVSENYEYVKFTNTKNGEDRIVPIFHKVSSLLKNRKERNLPKPFPFSISSVEWTWSKVRKELGMSNEKDFVIHSLRHTCITRLIKNGVGIEVAQLVAGHEDIRMTQKYNHPTKEELRKAIKNVYTKDVTNGNRERETH